MSKTKRTLTMILAMVVVAAISIAGTLAYLKSETQAVKNTFTVGKVEITLDEAKVDEYGDEESNESRVYENEYKLIPGHEYTKDPTIHVDAESEDCYLAVKIENGLGNDAEIAMAEGWSQLEEGSDIWVYADAVSAEDDVVVFSTFTFAEDADPADYEDAAINIIAYAVQEDGFDSAAEAYNAAFGTENNTADDSTDDTANP